MNNQEKEILNELGRWILEELKNTLSINGNESVLPEMIKAYVELAKHHYSPFVESLPDNES